MTIGWKFTLANRTALSISGMVAKKDHPFITITMTTAIHKYILDTLASGKSLASNFPAHPNEYSEGDVAQGIEWLSSQGFIVAHFQAVSPTKNVVYARAMLLSGDNFRNTLH